MVGTLLRGKHSSAEMQTTINICSSSYNIATFAGR